ncbi:MAG TPA: 50S ribosomal protein L4 [Polyangia bacterium]|nr:50S ribosomal protein L4 [Polyangia bacterium]
MAKIEVKNLDGKSVGHVELDDAVFGVEVNEHLLWESVKQQRANQRAGTHSTKRRSEVRGGGKKPYKQKGTGNARQGSTRSPQFVGGGSVFGPKPRDYSYSMPKKAMAGALRSALSLRTKESKIVVVEDFALDAIKTARVAEILETLGAHSALIVDGENEKLAKSARNLGAAKYLAPAGLNVYDVLNHETLILTRPTVEAITKRLHPVHEKHEKAEGGQ